MKKNEILIIGGGPAGLTAAIHLAQNGVEVTLFEKDAYPRHKVCGEYLSLEVLPYLKKLQIPFHELHAPPITELLYSTPRGKSIKLPLPLGAVGVSRYALDNLLYEAALKNGVKIIREKVVEIAFLDPHFAVTSTENRYEAHYVLACFGKRSLLDKNMNREFFHKPAPWVAVKNHYKSKDFPQNLVALHNFKGGYCGLSRTETGAVNMSYLATYQSFKKYKNPEKFTEKVLRKNPFLDGFLSRAVPIFEQPLSIAQISFSKKESVKNHVLMLGDAAGLIHPLCGNGMAIAIHSAKIASEVLLAHFKNATTRSEMEAQYQREWEKTFNSRFKTAALLQKILLNENLAEFSQTLVSKMPFLLSKIISNTHGKPISE